MSIFKLSYLQKVRGDICTGPTGHPPPKNVGGGGGINPPSPGIYASAKTPNTTDSHGFADCVLVCNICGVTAINHHTLKPGAHLITLNDLRDWFGNDATIWNPILQNKPRS